MAGKTKRTTYRSRLETMVTTIREEIITNKRCPGEYLPSEMTLGEQFRLSRSSIRKGLDILVAEGFIKKIPRVGNQICKPDASSRVTLTFGYYPSLMIEADLLSLIDRFHDLYPQIQIEPIPIPYADDQPTVKQYMERGLIDVATINYHNFQEFTVSDGDIELLEPLEQNEDIYGFLSRPFVANGALRVLPFIFSPVILCYNKDHFNELDIPEPDSSWTWEILETISLKLLKNKGCYGFFCHMMSDNRWPIFLLQSGHQFLRSPDRPSWYEDSKVLEGLRISKDLIHKQGMFPFLSESDADAEALFAQQKVSMIMATYFSLNSLRSANLNFDIAPLPTFHDPKTLLLMIGVAIHRDSPHKAAANTFIRYLLSYETQLHIRKNTLSIPSIKKAAEWQGEENVKHSKRFHMYREIIPTFQLYTHLNLSAEQLTRMRHELKLYWSQIDDLDTVCRRITEII